MFTLIKITDISGTEKYINPDLVEQIEVVPDTLLTLFNGHRYLAREEPEEIIRRIAEFKSRCNIPTAAGGRQQH